MTTCTFEKLWNAIKDTDRGRIKIAGIVGFGRNTRILSFTLVDGEQDGEKFSELQFKPGVSTLLFYPDSREVMMKTSSSTPSNYGYPRYSFDDEIGNAFFPVWDLHYPEPDKQLTSTLVDLCACKRLT